MVKFAGKGSEALNARQGSTSRGGGRGRGGRGSRNRTPRLGVAGPSRPSNLNPGRPIGGYLNALIGPISRTPKDTSGPSGTNGILPGPDKRGMSFILAAIDHVDPGNAVAFTAAATTAAGTATAGPCPSDNERKKGKMVAAAAATTPLTALPDDGSKMGKIDATTSTTFITPPCPPGGEGEAPKMAADVATTSGSEPAKMADDGRPVEEVEEGEIVEHAVAQVVEEKTYIVPDLNLLPPPDE